MSASECRRPDTPEAAAPRSGPLRSRRPSTVEDRYAAMSSLQAFDGVDARRVAPVAFVVHAIAEHVAIDTA